MDANPFEFIQGSTGKDVEGFSHEMYEVKQLEDTRRKKI
jgi:hypothetical protein